MTPKYLGVSAFGKILTQGLGCQEGVYEPWYQRYPVQDKLSQVEKN